MPETFLTDITFIFVGAALGAAVARLLRMPLLLGYLLMGVGFCYFDVVRDPDRIREISELGVLLLMFYIGLEFDVSKLKQVMLPTASAIVVQSIVMTALGFGIMHALHLRWSEGVLLSGLLCASSSTMATIPILTAQGALRRHYGQLAVSVLIIEDIIAVLLLVVLSGWGAQGSVALSTVGQTTFFIGAFVVMVLFVGHLVAPHLVRFLEKFDDDELLTISVIAFMLLVGALSKHYSLPLGAFLAGTLLSRFVLAKQIVSTLESLRDTFSALFFVSIGMLIEPKALVANLVPIAIITILLVLGKAFACWLGFFLAGQKNETALRASLSKAHLGEFGFIIATLGVQTKIIDAHIMTLITGVSLGSFILAPILNRNATTCMQLAKKYIPQYFQNLGVFYQNFLENIHQQSDGKHIWEVAKRPLGSAIVYFLLLNGVIGLTSAVANFAIIDSVKLYELPIQVALWTASAIAVFPFFNGIIRNVEALCVNLAETAFRQRYGATTQYIQKKIVGIAHKILLAVMTLAAGSLFLSAAAIYLPIEIVVVYFSILGIFLMLFFWKNVSGINGRLENMFMESFRPESDNQEEEQRKRIIDGVASQYMWEIKIHKILIRRHANVVGKRIADINLRAETGATVIGISRGTTVYYDPSPEVPLFPGDQLYILGDEEQLQAAHALLTAVDDTQRDSIASISSWTVDRICLSPTSPLVNETLIGAQLRNKFGVNVVGMQRDQSRIEVPKPTQPLKNKDVLFVVGNPEQIETFKTWAVGTVTT